ncbi:hypothetical protein BKA70DRAFT_1227625 [Coprinopsis sp. MPI-PUGE-AT-0042]|nr:hypothetical protein BKA70DRAFT_1227625 [Coprinopsis sp. MPI-PUGE-AT-0042]
MNPFPICKLYGAALPGFTAVTIASSSTQRRALIAVSILSHINGCNARTSIREAGRLHPAWLTFIVVLVALLLIGLALRLYFFYKAARAAQAMLSRQEPDGIEGGNISQQRPTSDFWRFRFVAPPTQINASDSTLQPLNPQQGNQFDASTSYNPSDMNTSIPPPYSMPKHPQ